MQEHGAIYLTPFSHRLAEEIDNAEYQRLRCRVNYHALRFKPNIMKLSESIVDKLRAQGHFMAIHLRFEMDMLAFAGYVLFLILLCLYYFMCSCHDMRVMHINFAWALCLNLNSFSWKIKKYNRSCFSLSTWYCKGGAYMHIICCSNIQVRSVELIIIALKVKKTGIFFL